MAPLTRAFIFICLAAAVKATTPKPCVIPPGQYDGQPVNYYDPEPRFGKLCHEPGMTQRMENKCLLHFCCTDDCTCDSPDLKDQFTNDGICKNTQIMCYKTKNYVRNFKYVCCNGSVYVHENRSCLERCADNSLGCEHQCAIIANAVQQCVCPPGFTLAADKKTCRDIDECQMRPKICPERCINKIGSYECVCNEGRQRDADGKCVDKPTTPPNPAHVAMTTAESEKSGMPAPYIAAIVVAGLLLLLLCCLLPLLLWLWRRRQRPEEDNSPTDAFGNAVYEKTGLPPYVVAVEKKDKKDKKFAGNEVTVVADDMNKPKPTVPTVYATISEKPKDMKLVGDETKTTADSTQTSIPPAVPAGRRADANEYLSLPTASGTVRKIIVVDKGGEYAEIRDVDVDKTNV